MCFLIDEICPVVAEFCVEMSFSSSSILNMVTNVKVCHNLLET